MNKRKITLTRRIVQIISLILIVYGGYLLKPRPGTYWGRHEITGNQAVQSGKEVSLFPQLKAPQGRMSTTQFSQGSILWPSGKTPVLENFPPGLICRFNPKGGMFKACILHFFNENLSWRTPIKYLLPHIALFMLLCFLLGRMWCGWVCPIGTVGDFLTSLRRKMNIPVRRFSNRMRRSLRSGAYGILAVSLSISAFIGIPKFTRFQCYWFLPYCQTCPARLICPVFGLIKPSWKDFSSAISAGFTILAWMILGVFIAAFYWGRRVWCHLCPVGLVNSWFNRGAGVELRKKAIRCNKCAACTDACPMGLTEMYELDKDAIFNQKGCTLCLRCIEVCPQKECLSMSFFGKEIVKSEF